MTPDIKSLMAILTQGQALWALPVSALLCLLIDAIWPKKFTVVIYLLGILTLGFSLFSTLDQWWGTVGQADVVASGGPLVFNRFALFFTPLIVMTAIFTLLNSLGYLGKQQKQASEFVALVLFAVLGMVLFAVSDHLILAFIGLETMSLAIYVLVGSQKKNLKSNEAAIKYFILGGVASAIFLYGIALFYGGFGTLSLSELALKVAAPDLAYLKNLGLGLMLVGLLFKMAIVPFHFWVPDVYQGAPSPVTGFMATGVKVATFGFVLRLFKELNVFDMQQTQMMLSVFVALTLIVGNLVAILQDDLKRMLAYSSISHAGFLLLGLVAGYVNGKYVFASGSVVLFYLLGYVVTSLGAFAVLSLMVHEKRDATTLGDISGFAKSHPVLAIVFSVFLLSLMGLPGTVGFSVKFSVIGLAIQNGHLALAILAVVASLVSAFYYLKPLALMYFKGGSGRDILVDNLESVFLYVTIVFCLMAVVVLGIKPDLYLPLTRLAFGP